MPSRVINDLMDPDGELPRIYVASKLSGLTADKQAEIEALCSTIVEAVVTAAIDDTPSWEVVVYAPVVHTAPWRSNDSAEQIWHKNLGLVVRQTDGMIVVGEDCGSIGVGNELTLALARSMPILYVHDTAQAVSRQTVGMAGDAFDMTIATYGSDTELREIVLSWARTKRDILRQGPFERCSTSHMWGPVTEMFLERWARYLDTAEPKDLAQLCFDAGMGPNEISEVTQFPLLMANLPAMKLVRLGTALGVPFAGMIGSLRRPHRLEDRQLAALDTWAKAAGASDAYKRVARSVGEHATMLEARQRSDEQFSGRPRSAPRFDLTKAADWERLMEQWKREGIS